MHATSLLMQGIRHTRASIGDVGKPRAIRQNTLVGHFQVLRLGGRVRSHRSRRRPVKWRSGHTCAQVNGLFACKGCRRCRSGQECRWWRGRCAHPAASRAQVRMEGCGVEWFGVPVPRLFLFVGALHPIRRQCTSSVRVHRHVTGAPPRNGCSAPVLVAVVATVGVVGVFWA